jgi:hypothetical protein
MHNRDLTCCLIIFADDLLIIIGASTFQSCHKKKYSLKIIFVQSTSKVEEDKNIAAFLSSRVYRKTIELDLTL